MTNAFIAKEHKARLNPIVWDKYYIDRKLVQKAKKTGEGEEDFTIVYEEVEEKRSIKETIDAQAPDVGLDNILKKFAVTGDQSILPNPVVDDGRIIDFTEMPQDLIEAGQYFANAKAMYDSLPAAIVKGRSFEEFMTNFTQAEYDAYVKDLKAVEAAKKDKEKEGEK